MTQLQKPVSQQPLLLICTVGKQAGPVLASIRHWRPAHIVFVCSADSRRTVKDSILPELCLMDPPYSEGQWTIRPVPDPEDLASSLEEMALLKENVAAWRDSHKGAGVVVDFTAGTKCMTATLAVQSLNWDCGWSYVAGERDCTTGTVKSGTEEVQAAQAPWRLLGFQALVDYEALFNRQDYHAAATVADRAKRLVPDSSRSREFAALETLAKVFASWDLFDHQKALQHLAAVDKFRNDLTGALGRHRSAKLYTDLLPLRRQLEKLVAEPPPTRAHILDLVANARRRSEQGRYDDAVARLYRAVEALAQLHLGAEHGIPSTARVLAQHIPAGVLDRLPEELQKRISAADGGRLGLQDAWILLCGMEEEKGIDGIGKRFAQLEFGDPERSPLTARNQSILAHGFSVATEDTASRLLNAVCKLGQISLERDLTIFPAISSQA